MSCKPDCSVFLNSAWLFAKNRQGIFYRHRYELPTCTVACLTGPLGIKFFNGNEKHGLVLFFVKFDSLSNLLAVPAALGMAFALQRFTLPTTRSLSPMPL